MGSLFSNVASSLLPYRQSYEVSFSCWWMSGLLGFTSYDRFITTITIEDIQRDLLGYLRQVQAGETFVIVQADRPVAEIRPIASSTKSLRPNLSFPETNTAKVQRFSVATNTNDSITI